VQQFQCQVPESRRLRRQIEMHTGSVDMPAIRQHRTTVALTHVVPQLNKVLLRF
jgi:hypothetical protein